MNGWKTLLASLVVALSGWFATPEVVQFLTQFPGWVTTGIGLLFGFLRVITTTSVALPWSKKP